MAGKRSDGDTQSSTSLPSTMLSEDQRAESPKKKAKQQQKGNRLHSNGSIMFLVHGISVAQTPFRNRNKWGYSPRSGVLQPRKHLKREISVYQWSVDWTLQQEPLEICNGYQQIYAISSATTPSNGIRWMYLTFHSRILRFVPSLRFLFLPIFKQWRIFLYLFIPRLV